MVTKLYFHHRGLTERRDDDHGPDLQRRSNHLLSEASQVILISSSDSLNQAVHFETLEHSGDLMSGFADHHGAKGTVLETTDIELSADDAFEQFQVFTVKEIKAAIGPLAIGGRLRDLFKVLDSHGGIIDLGDELQVTSVRRFHQFPKNGKAVNGFPQRGVLHFPSAVPMFHLPVVFEKTDVIDRCLYTQNDPQFVIHLNRNRTHVVFDSGSFDSGVEIIANLSLIGCVKLSSQEGCDLLGFDGVDRRTGDRFIEGTKIALVFENHIRSKLNLHQCPMITGGEMPDHRTKCFRHAIQSPVKESDLKIIGQLLGLGEILRLDEGIVQETIGEPLPVEKAGQVMVSVKIELEPEGSPGRHPQIAQPQIFKDEVEIVVDAFGFRTSEKGLARLLVMPGLERRTALHGGEDVDQPMMIPALGDDLFQTFFLPEILLSDEFNLQTILPGQLLRMETDFVPQGFDKLGIIENANALGSQMATHGIGIADIGKCPGDDYPIKTRKDSSNFTGISFCQRNHGSNLLRDVQKDSLCL